MGQFHDEVTASVMLVTCVAKACPIDCQHRGARPLVPLLNVGGKEWGGVGNAECLYIVVGDSFVGNNELGGVTVDAGESVLANGLKFGTEVCYIESLNFSLIFLNKTCQSD